MAKEKTLSEKLHEQWMKERGLNKTEKNKSYNHKPHLKDLPYDRRSTSKDELSERFMACREKYLEKANECAEIQNQIDKDKKTMKENMEKDKEIYRRLDDDMYYREEFKEMDDMEYARKREIYDNLLERAQELNLPESQMKNIERMGNIILSGLTDEYTANELNKTAGKIIDYRYEISEDDTGWAKQVDGIADDLRMIGKNDDKLVEAHSKLIPDDEVESLRKQSDECYSNFSKAEENYRSNLRKRDNSWNIAKDYYNEGENTFQRMRDLDLV